MKKLVSNILALGMGAFAFLGLLMPMFMISQDAVVTKLENVTSGYDFLKLSYNEIESALSYHWAQVAFSIAVIILFVLAGILVLFSVAKLLLEGNKKYKKVNWSSIQTILSVLVALVSIAILIFVICYISGYNDNLIMGIAPASIGVGAILLPIVSVICAGIITVFNKK